MADKPKTTLTYDQIVLAANGAADDLRRQLADKAKVVDTLREIARKALNERDDAIAQRDAARVELARGRPPTKPTTQDLVDATRALLAGLTPRTRAFANGSTQH